MPASDIWVIRRGGACSSEAPWALTVRETGEVVGCFESQADASEERDRLFAEVLAENPPGAAQENVEEQRDEEEDELLPFVTAFAEEYRELLAESGDAGQIAPIWEELTYGTLAEPFAEEATAEAIATAVAMGFDPATIPQEAADGLATEHLIGFAAFGGLLAATVARKLGIEPGGGPGSTTPEEAVEVDEVIAPFLTPDRLSRLTERVRIGLRNGACDLALSTATAPLPEQARASLPESIRPPQTIPPDVGLPRRPPAAPEGPADLPTEPEVARTPPAPPPATTPPEANLPARRPPAPTAEPGPLPIIGKVWLTMRDSRVRSAHAEADGQTVPVQGVFDIGGFPARYPGDPSLPPELRIGCRCFLAPAGIDADEFQDRVAGAKALVTCQGGRIAGGGDPSTIVSVGALVAQGEITPADIDLASPVGPPATGEGCQIPGVGGLGGGGSVVAGGRRATLGSMGHPKTATFQRQKLTQEQAGFVDGGGEAGRRCGDCLHFQVERRNGCAIVEGEISAGDVCDFYQPAETPAAVAMSTEGASLFLTGGPDYTQGVMVCLRPTQDQAEALAVPNGLSAETLHVTLGYFGNLDRDELTADDRDRIVATIERLMGSPSFNGALEGEVSTLTTFEANPDRPFIALVDAPGLGRLRTVLVENLDPDLRPSGDHDFVPHITLGYDASTEEQERYMAGRVGIPLRFNALELVWGTESTVVDFPIREAEEDPEVRATPTRTSTAEFAEEPSALSDGDLVLIDGLDGMAGGLVTAVEVEGTFPDADGNPIEATEDSPVFVLQVWLFDPEAGSWVETDALVGYRASELTRVDELPVPDAVEDETEPEMDEAAVTLQDETPVALDNATRAERGDFEWEGVLIVEGIESGDRRLIAEGALTWRDLPLTLMVQLQNPESGGHALAIPGGSIWEIERVGNEIVGRGFFDSGEGGATLRRMLEEGTIKGVSADIDMVESDLLFQDGEAEPVFVLTSGRVMGATATPFPAFQEAFIRLVEVDEEIEAVVASAWSWWEGTELALVASGADSDQVAAHAWQQPPQVFTDDGGKRWMLASAWEEWTAAHPWVFEVIGAADLPIADRDTEWDGSAAAQRVADICRSEAGDLDPACYSRAFFYRDPDADPETVGAYRLGFADVINGRLQAVPRGIFAVAGVLEGARGGTDIPEADQERIRGRVSTYYERMRDQFDDPSLVPPWEDA